MKKGGEGGGGGNKSLYKVKNETINRRLFLFQILQLQMIVISFFSIQSLLSNTKLINIKEKQELQSHFELVHEYQKQLLLRNLWMNE
ncbi:transmembrane protein, putative (macronuclear) [Tetrahymena thermophila SB210]|uniref:Transmembrane protein, putative n=1 Tax=Tetrahymena thermophila (strain SB210) TaxID=312017 RepID=W7XFL1_TETTS|nr:transmembrane protein, putative [Tetrahymena thermophila SB210]EWS76647.1 transmembrane protein, putative [Tetrahymena thermophila SB210]|eukprot:XP_012650815.1 transmembrane protein, putative [Tetrahymena thermophila SB210]